MKKTIATFAIFLTFAPVAQIGAFQTSAQLAKQETSPRAQILSIYLSGRRPIAILRVAAHPPAPVIFDTGTSGNDIDSDYASAIGLTFNPDVDVRVEDGTGHSFTAKQAVLPLASLGGVKIAEKTATVFPYKEQDVVGIFGPSSFSGRQVLLNLDQGRVIVKDRGPKPMAGGTDYGDDDLPRIPVQVAGRWMSALLDSGNDTDLLLPEELAHKVPLRGPLKVIGKATTVTGQRNVYAGRLAGNIRIGHILLRNPEVHFSGRQVNVGLPIIRQLRIMLDPEKRKVWVVEPRALSTAQLREFAGRFAIRTLRIEKGRLIYQRDERTPYRLTYLGDDLFAFEGSKDMLQFWRTAGKVTAADLINADGDVIRIERTS